VGVCGVLHYRDAARLPVAPPLVSGDDPRSRADGLEFRAAGPDDEAQVLALAERTLGWGPEPRWADLFRWKHDENAFGVSPRWVAVDDGRVVGFRVFLRWEWVDADGVTHRAVRAVDTATDPAYQGRGIFTRLTKAALEDLRADGVGFVFNTPNDQSRPGYLKMGWQVVGRPPVMTVPARPSGIGRLAKARTAADLWSEATDAGLDAATVFAGAAAEDLAGRLDRPDALATARSIAYLRWRYGLAPLRYRTVGLGSDPAEGLAVFRVRRRGPALEATVTDLLVPAGADAGHRRRALLRRVVRSAGADFVLVGHHRSLLGTPALAVRGLGPILTWREVTETTPPTLASWALTMGDLELF
jgi:GNAT superfamily N-acetyltransferase